MPVLTAIGDTIGVYGGYLVATLKPGLHRLGIYLKNTVDFATHQDITSGLIKAAVFGFIVALMGCYNGFHSKGGAQGVGRGDHQCRGVVLHPDPGRRLSSSPRILFHTT